MRFCKVFLSSLGLLGMLSSMASAQLLYDASELKTPDQEQWAYSELFGSPTITAPTVTETYTTLDSNTSAIIRAGYGQLAPNPIESNARFTFALQLNSETHNNANRAGLSVIVLGNALSGIELGFWNNEVWAQNVGFTHGEGAAFTMTGSGTGLGGLNQFALNFGGGSYSLYANDSPTALLTGSLRNYSAFGFPYNIPNTIFVGDDTSSARASFRFSQFSIAPEPSALPLFLFVGMLLSPTRRAIFAGATRPRTPRKRTA